MRRFAVFAVLLFALSGCAAAGTVRLAWDPNPAGENVTGYNVYRDGLKIASTVVTVFEYVDAAAPAGADVVYTVTAVNPDGESDPSAPVTARIASRPSNLRKK